MSKIFGLCNSIVLLLHLQQVEPETKLNFDFKNESFEYKDINIPFGNRFRLNLEVPLTKKFNETLILLENQIENIRQQNEELKAKLDENSETETIRQQYQELKAMLHENSKISTGYLRNYDEHLNCLQDCEPYQSCSEMKTPEDGAFVFKIPNSDLPPFYAYCRLEDENSSWTVIQRREDGSVNFNRGWHDYKYGFGDVYGEYWLGLERLHQLTNSRDHELKIVLFNYDHEERYAIYSKFFIAGEGEGYKLTCDEYRGDVGNSFGRHNGFKFTTFDKKNDKIIRNCAQWHKGGWWYKSCYSCNLNGRYLSQSDKNDHGIKWNEWNSKESLKHVVMQIRPLK